MLFEMLEFILVDLVIAEHICYLFLSILQTGECQLDNLALGKYAYSSSIDFQNLFNTSASLAVDGIKTTANQLCFMANEGPGSSCWMGLDLEKLTSIQSVVVYSGLQTPTILSENAQENLNNFIVGVTNTSLDIQKPVFGQYCLCGQYSGTVSLAESVQLNCSSTTHPGRFVIIQQPSNGCGYMTICELEIYGEIIEDPFRNNILLKKPVRGSSTYLSFLPEYMVDGFHDTIIRNLHCAHTNDEINKDNLNWFVVDMINQYYVDFIVLTSRIYANTRTRNFRIGLSNTDPSISPPIRGQYPLCGRYPGDVENGIKVSMKCKANLEAYRYLIAQQGIEATEGGWFAICELEAYEALFRDRYLWRISEFGTNMKLEGYNLLTLNVRSIQHCISECKKYGGCDSINYENNLKLCQLNRHTNGYANVSFVSDQPAWNHWEVFYYGI